MSIDLNRISEEEKDTLKHLMQFYFYDFSEFTDADLQEDGLFSKYRYFDDYWIETDCRFPYFIRVDGKLAGFVMVRKIDAEAGFYFSMAEFFVMKKYRRRGTGSEAAKRIFDLHKGEWEVTQIERNVPAQKFWVKVISEYTEGRFTDRFNSGERVQKFGSR